MTAAERVGDMTRAELEQVILNVIRRHTRTYPYMLPGDGRPFEEVFQDLVANMIKLPAGSPSTLELLREDRDR